ncbi:MAG: neutral zinc metallopeptidase [Hyphomicrobium sp.]
MAYGRKLAIVAGICAALALMSRADAELATPDPSGPEAMRAELTRAWDDATETWRRILGERTYANELPQINFVATVRPSHCYGLYINAGPVYCSGNNTVFISIDEMERLSQRLGGAEPAGLAFLVAHELGHHVQKATGRFVVLSNLMRANPQRTRELVLRFELEADCLAGVWASNSRAFASNAAVRKTMLATIAEIGDDKAQSAAGGLRDPATYTHGTSQQRQTWYGKGLAAGEASACSVLEAAVI